MTPVSNAAETGELFTAYHDRVCRYIMSMIRDAAEAEDLTQETFLRAHCQQDKLRDDVCGRAKEWQKGVDASYIAGRSVAGPCC